MAIRITVSDFLEDEALVSVFLMELVAMRPTTATRWFIEWQDSDPNLHPCLLASCLAGQKSRDQILEVPAGHRTVRGCAEDRFSRLNPAADFRAAR